MSIRAMRRVMYITVLLIGLVCMANAQAGTQPGSSNSALQNAGLFFQRLLSKIPGAPPSPGASPEEIQAWTEKRIKAQRVILPPDENEWYVRYGRFEFRPRLFKTEGALLFAFGLYLISYFWGKRANLERATRHLSASIDIYNEQFALFGNGQGDSLLFDTPSTYLLYGSGRRNCKYLHGTISLRARHLIFNNISADLANYLYPHSYLNEDTVKLIFHITIQGPPRDQEYVWGVVNKNEMAHLKKERYDLNFTKVTEIPLLPGNLAILQETGEVTDVIFPPGIKSSLEGEVSTGTPKHDPRAVALVKALRGPASQYLSYLIITDSPDYKLSSQQINTEVSVAAQGVILKPTNPSNFARRVELQFRLPSTGIPFVQPDPKEYAKMNDLLEAVFGFIDIVSSFKVRPETGNKLRKKRQDAILSIKKEESGEDSKTDKVDPAQARALARKKAEAERVSKLSPEEQRKHEERERRIELKRDQKKLTRRG